MSRLFAWAALVAILLQACGGKPTAQKEPAVLADAFFYARAYIDANGDGAVNDGDPPLKGAYFSAAGSNGTDSGGRTNSRGSAMAWFPGGGVEYPVTLRMEPGPDSGFLLIGPLEVVLQEGESATPEFLFAEVVTPTDSTQ